MELREASAEYLVSKGPSCPPGYKQTEVGVIPEDWEVKSTDQISEVKSGKRLPLGNSLTEKETAYPYIRVADMVLGTVNLEGIKYVPEHVYPSIKNYRIFVDDIFISVAGTLGIVGKIPPQLDGANLTENADRLTNIRCDRDYLMYMLMSPQIQNTIESERTLGAQPKLALTRIRKFQIPFPPIKTEQTAIANALSDVDGLIQSLTRLIAKKRQIKQGAMQTLLNPYENGRLKEGWVVKKLGDVGIFSKGSGVRKDESQSGYLPCIRYGEIYTRHSDYIKQFYSFISEDVAKTAKRLKKGDLLFAGSGETKEEIGKCVGFATEIEAYAGGDIVILRPDSGNSLFYGYYLNTNRINKQKASKGQGDAVVHISANAIGSIDIIVPEEPSEQTRIANILSDMDAEIATLGTKLAKYQQIKQGMMQNLLTGRIRLVKPEAKEEATP